MFDVIEKWTGNGVVALHATGRLTHEDYEKLVPMLLEVIEEHGAIRCLIDLTGLERIEPRAVLDELRFDLKHGKEVARCAVVGDHAWERWATETARPLFRNADVAFFAPEDLEQAAEWVREGLPPQPIE
jgi:universal stress protein A